MEPLRRNVSSRGHNSQRRHSPKRSHDPPCSFPKFQQGSFCVCPGTHSFYAITESLSSFLTCAERPSSTASLRLSRCLCESLFLPRYLPDDLQLISARSPVGGNDDGKEGKYELLSAEASLSQSCPLSPPPPLGVLICSRITGETSAAPVITVFTCLGSRPTLAPAVKFISPKLLFIYLFVSF